MQLPADTCQVRAQETGSQGRNLGVGKGRQSSSSGTRAWQDPCRPAGGLWGAVGETIKIHTKDQALGDAEALNLMAPS